MKYDYDRLSDDEIDELYYDEFGRGFAVNWDDNSSHRAEEIACIESGVPQDLSTVHTWDASEGVPGVDFVA